MREGLCDTLSPDFGLEGAERDKLREILINKIIFVEKLEDWIEKWSGTGNGRARILRAHRMLKWVHMIWRDPH